jgi:hypothetical protein
MVFVHKLHVPHLQLPQLVKVLEEALLSHGTTILFSDTTGTPAASVSGS